MSTYIKQETTDWHQKLESAPLLKALVQNKLSTETYQQALIKFWGIFDPLERQLQTLINYQDLTQFYTYKAGYLQTDLNYLSINTSSLACLELSTDSQTTEPYLATLYWLLGSNLGSSYIYKKLKQSTVPSQATHFFQHNQVQWAAFIQQLDQHHELQAESLATSINQLYQEAFIWFIN